MENTDLEKKYHTIATEYSKVRSQATVLKKAVLDEQTRNNDLKETVKELQQKIRKHNQEMDSLTFRNEQLTKRISVLQQELHVNTSNKKSKTKNLDSGTSHVVDFGILDEELHKKILENAELVSSMADKDQEIANSQDKIEWLEQKLCRLQKEIHDSQETHSTEIEKLKANFNIARKLTAGVEEDLKIAESIRCEKETTATSNFWKQEAERWRAECELLKAKPEANDKLTQYYESQITELLESKQLAYSETNSLQADNQALIARLEQLILEKNYLENSILSNAEELNTTNENYKNQLDAMTEHLAAQNEKITKQCDEIQILKHKLTSKK